MAKILLIKVGDDEVQTESVMGERTVKWCIDNLKLEDDPIPLGKKVELMKHPRDRGGTQQVFVKVSEDESGLVKPGFYPIDKNPAEVRRLLNIEE